MCKPAELVAWVALHPGATTKEVAKAFGLAVHVTHNKLVRLHAFGKLSAERMRSDGGRIACFWHLAGATAANYANGDNEPLLRPNQRCVGHAWRIDHPIGVNSVFTLGSRSSTC